MSKPQFFRLSSRTIFRNILKNLNYERSCYLRTVNVEHKPFKKRNFDTSGNLKDVENTSEYSSNSPKQTESTVVTQRKFEQLETNVNSINHTDVWSTSVYPPGIEHIRDQTKYSIRPLIDPRSTTIMQFPGQGSQFSGMGKEFMDLSNVGAMFEIASDILKYDLKDLCLNGPKSRLDRTEHCQAAILVTSLAAVEKLRIDQPEVIENCVAALGFSSGEITALIFAGAISFEDGIKLIKVRGEAMQAASEMWSGGMMNVFCYPDAKISFACHVAKEWCIKQDIENPVCSIANYLFPDCKVIAGNQEALEFIELNAKEFKIKKLKHLNVSGAFHTNLMKPAEPVLEAALREIKLSKPLIPVHSNVDGHPYSNEKDIFRKLKKQLCSPVKWEQTLHTVYARSGDTPFPRTFECGPGKSLRAILKRVNFKAWNNSYSIGDVDFKERLELN